MIAQTFADVFDALADTAGEAATLKLRADLLAALGARICQWNLPQDAAASRLGMVQERLGDLLEGRLSGFSLDELVGLAAMAGLAVEVRSARAA